MFLICSQINTFAFTLIYFSSRTMGCKHILGRAWNCLSREKQNLKVLLFDVADDVIDITEKNGFISHLKGKMKYTSFKTIWNYFLYFEEKIASNLDIMWYEIHRYTAYISKYFVFHNMQTFKLIIENKQYMQEG